MKLRSLGSSEAAIPRPSPVRRVVMGLMLAAAAVAPLSPTAAQAALTYSGDLNPGNPSLWTTGTNAYVGQTADGSLAIDGKSVAFSGSSWLGYNAGVTGTVAVSGSGSKFTGYKERYVGFNGTGVLNITGSGAASNTLAYLGYNTGSTGTVTVDGAGSKWTSNGTSYIGNSGAGTLTITNGGTATNTDAYLGYNTGSTGTVTVDGAASKWNNAGTIYVGQSGTGILNAINGSTVTATGGISVGTLGTLNVDSSTVTASGALTVATSGKVNINGSTLTVPGGVTIGTSGKVNFGASGGTLRTTALTASSGQFTGTGTVITNKFLGDANFVVNTSSDLTQKIATWNASGQNIGVYVDLAGTYGAGDLAVGYRSSGSMAINNGLGVVSANAYVGYNAGATGTVAVNGSGSKWTTSALNVGNSGTGTVSVKNGASASIANNVNLAYSTGSRGTVTVDGASSTFIGAGQANIGYRGVGTLNITNGGAVSNAAGYIGYNTGSTGTVTVDGAGSSWTDNGSLQVGLYGTAALNILNGSSVSVTGDTTVGTLGKIYFGASGGTLTTNSLYYASPSQFTGTGTINTSGIVGDLDLVFNSSHGTSQALSLNGVTVNLNQNSSGTLGVGYAASGSLTIADGVSVASNAAYLGYKSGATGTATVTGSGSTWTTNGDFVVGRSGNGVLKITNGGTVINNNNYAGTYIGYNSGSTGTVTVNGAGSQWVSRDIRMDQSGKAVLNVTDGGAVNASSISMNASSLLTVDLGRGSSVSLSSSISNNGTIRLVAGAGAANGTYTPITAATGWYGSGSVQALGGIWDSTNHTVTISGAAKGAAGSVLTADLSTTQRFLFTDGCTGKSVGAAFQGAADPTSLAMTASAISGSELTSLQSLVGTGNAVLSGWDFTTSGYTTGDPVYLSLFAGSGHSLSDLTIWHYDGSAWSKYAAGDLAYDNTYANFTVTGFSGYAVSGTAPVPIPAAAWLLGSGVIGLAGMRRRKSVC